MPLRRNPDAKSEQMAQLRYGDAFTQYEQKDGWVWGQSARDSYVGYVEVAALADGSHAPTHRIKILSSLVFEGPSLKTPPLDRLTLFSAVAVTGVEGKFAALSTGGFVHMRHLCPLAEWQEPDIVFNAGRFLGVPYLWGGNSALGVDCSGLVQLACEMAGMVVPRDSDMQAESLGKKVADGFGSVTLKRGDLIFFKGHVGIMADEFALLHANGFHGCVAVEPLANVIARGDAVVKVRRLS